MSIFGQNLTFTRHYWHPKDVQVTSEHVRIRSDSLVRIWPHSSQPISDVQGTSYGRHLMSASNVLETSGSDRNVRFGRLQDVHRTSAWTVSYMSESDFVLTCPAFFTYQYRHKVYLGFYGFYKLIFDDIIIQLWIVSKLSFVQNLIFQLFLLILIIWLKFYLTPCAVYTVC